MERLGGNKPRHDFVLSKIEMNANPHVIVFTVFTVSSRL